MQPFTGNGDVVLTFLSSPAVHGTSSTLRLFLLVGGLFRARAELSAVPLPSVDTIELTFLTVFLLKANKLVVIEWEEKKLAFETEGCIKGDKATRVAHWSFIFLQVTPGNQLQAPDRMQLGFI